MANVDILSLTVVPETVFSRYAVIPTSHKQPPVANNITNVDIAHCLKTDEFTEEKIGRITDTNTKQASDAHGISQGLVYEMFTSSNDPVKFDVKHQPYIHNENIPAASTASDMNVNRNKIVLLPRTLPGKQNRITVHRADISFSEADKPEDDIAHRNYLKLKKEYLKKRREIETDGKANLQKQKRDLETVTTFVSDLVRYQIPRESFEIRKPRYRNITSSFNIDANDECQPELLVKDPERADGVTGSARSISREAGSSGDSKLKRNTRFGGNQKETAYRPCTSLDGFRRTYQTPVSNSQCTEHSLDVEGGRRIWSEIDNIVDKSQKLDRKGKTEIKITRKGKSETKMNQLSDKYPRDGNNSIELMACFCRLPGQQQAMSDRQMSSKSDCTIKHDQGIQCDDNTTYVGNNLQGGESSRVALSSPVPMARSAICSPRGDSMAAKSAVCSTRGDSMAARSAVCSTRGEPVIRSEDLSDLWPHPTRILLIHPAKADVDAPFISIPSVGACRASAGVTMTTTLPRITPCSTPLPPGVAKLPQRSHSSASMYTAYPPKELSSSVDFLHVPGRVNPLAPPPPRRRINWSWETTDQHYENEKRRLLMQKREHTRYHSAWSKAFYGPPAEKEAYRRHFREVLKQQMTDKDSDHKSAMINKKRESEQAIAYDNDCRRNDAQEYFRKHTYLMQYRDGNKEQMETTWSARQQNKRVEDRVDREKLRYNPINWSCSLK